MAYGGLSLAASALKQTRGYPPLVPPLLYLGRLVLGRQVGALTAAEVIRSPVKSTERSR